MGTFRILAKVLQNISKGLKKQLPLFCAKVAAE
jgi:hypothetical protein